MEKLARIPVTVEIASEFRYQEPILSKDDLVILISQSGETADTLAALRLSREKGAATLAVANVVGSTISREADFVLYTWAGPEIAVASTKAYCVQLSAMYLLAIKLAVLHGKITPERERILSATLLDTVPELVDGILQRRESFRPFSDIIAPVEDLFYIGRGLDYALSMEASLKLKEITYIHSEAYAAGELKHGTISMITDGVPVVAIATADTYFEKTLSNIKEVRARGAHVILICKESAAASQDVAHDVIALPVTEEIFMPLLVAPVFQLIAYYTSVKKGCDVDKPRNLAKSVTVE